LLFTHSANCHRLRQIHQSTIATNITHGVMRLSTMRFANVPRRYCREKEKNTIIGTAKNNAGL
jgi:hypothetical protein